MENFYAKIEAYNHGKMTPAEAEQFELAMAADPALHKATMQHRTEWEAQELLAEKLLRAQIRQHFDTPPPVANNWFSNNWRWLLPVGGLLLAGGIWLFVEKAQPSPTPPSTPPPTQNWPAEPTAPLDSTKKQPEPKNGSQPIAKQEDKPNWDALAAAAYDLPENLSGLRGQDGDVLSQAASAFSDDKYRQVVQLLTPLPDDSQQEALALRAHAKFLAEEYAAAADDFAELEAGGIYRRDAEWFGLLARMAAGKLGKKELKKQLDAIRNNEKHPHKPAADALSAKVATGF